LAADSPPGHGSVLGSVSVHLSDSCLWECGNRESGQSRPVLPVRSSFLGFVPVGMWESPQAISKGGGKSGKPRKPGTDASVLGAHKSLYSPSEGSAPCGLQPSVPRVFANLSRSFFTPFHGPSFPYVPPPLLPGKDTARSRCTHGVLTIRLLWGRLSACEPAFQPAPSSRSPEHFPAAHHSLDPRSVSSAPCGFQPSVPMFSHYPINARANPAYRLSAPKENRGLTSLS